MKRIIDNKRIEMTNEEYTMYTNICRSYDRPNFKGEDLFRDLFETNEDGIITFIKPPNKNYSSMEVWLFILSIMNNQHMRINRNQVQALCDEGKEKFKEIIIEAKKSLDEIKEILATLKKVDSDSNL